MYNSIEPLNIVVTSNTWDYIHKYTILMFEKKLLFVSIGGKSYRVNLIPMGPFTWSQLGDAVILIKSCTLDNNIEQFVREKYPTIPIIVRSTGIFNVCVGDTDTVDDRCDNLLKSVIRQIIKDKPAAGKETNNEPIIKPEVTIAAGTEDNISTNINRAGENILNVDDIIKAIADNFEVSTVTFDVKRSALVFKIK
jgi:hypothetical protein